MRCSRVFQSTPPARGATAAQPWEERYPKISIHAPREGGDHSILRLLNDRPNISIHAPREGGDLNYVPLDMWEELFQSTPPARGATASLEYSQETYEISIHAPREGGDSRR